MSQAVFEKAGTFSFTAVKGLNAEPIAPHSLVSARLYLDSPTEAQIADSSYTGGDALQNVTTWTAGTNPHERLIAYAAIADDEPTAEADYDLRYWVVSYRLGAAGTIVNQVKPIVVWRSRVVSSRFDCVETDLYVLEEKLENLLGDPVVSAKIAVAERFVVNDLRSKGINVAKLEQADAKDLVRYQALKICCRGLSNGENDEWWAKADSYAQDYMTVRDSLPIGVDGDDDGDIEPDEQVQLNEALGFFHR
jgi:hypothetical protein